MRPADELDMASPTSNPQALPRLCDNGSNWVDYESQIRNVMESRGLIQHVKGTTRWPAEYLLEDSFPVIKPGVQAMEDEIKTKECRLDEFDQWEYMAWHVIHTTVSTWLTSIIKTKTAKEMWDAVKEDATLKSKLHHKALPDRNAMP